MIDIVKDNDLFLTKDECKLLGQRVLIRSGESVVYENSAQGLIYKVRDPFAKIHLKSDDLRNVLFEHIVHNLLFPDAKYTFVGISEYNDSVRLVYSQKLVFGINRPTQQQIDGHLASLGLLPEDRYYYGNEFVSVTDVDANSDNVLLSDDGRLIFIDPIIRIKKPVDEIISAYPFASVIHGDSSQGLLSRLKRLFQVGEQR